MRQDDEHLLEERLDGVLALVKERFGGDADKVATFAKSYFADVLTEDIVGQSVESLYGAVASMWQVLKQRKHAGPKIRVYNPDLEQNGWQSTHTAIEIVNDDMPFLVDSVVTRRSRRVLKRFWAVCVRQSKTGLP